MQEFADVEIRLQRQYAEHYPVEIRFSPAGSDEDRVVVSEALQKLDLARLRDLATDPGAYGAALTEMFFGGQVGPAFATCRAVANQDDVPLRVRLYISPNASDLHTLRWETLRDPETGDPLLTSERVVFSRFLSSDDWRRVQRRSQSDLRALVVVANPSDIESYAPGGTPLATIDVEQEVAQAKAGLGTIPATVIDRATLNGISEKLRDGYDILYLVCHGALRDGEPILWLVGDDGTADVVSGRALVTRLRELVQVPRLVILASCQSAGTGDQGREQRQATDDGALSALAPEVAKAGVPAVIGIQGNITQATLRQFLPEFFKQLLHDGQIDQAMATARGTVRERSDAWMPVLYMRLKSGRLWFAPGFADDQGSAFRRWRTIAASVSDGECTPILGPGLTEPLLGTRREIARRLARKSEADLVLHERDDLPQIAQFLTVDQDPRFARRALMDLLRDDVRERVGLPPPTNGAGMPPDRVLNELLFQRLQQLQQNDPTEPHQVLAQLPFKLYITASPTDLLTQTLQRFGKQPTVLASPWREMDPATTSPIDEDYEPDVEHPLVYHAFGRFRDQSGWVLTEDDYFDYLIGMSSPKRTREMPPAVQRLVGRVNSFLANSSLLFLGFQTDDWNFRVLFRMIVNQQSSELRRTRTHVAVQVQPDEDGIVRPDRARDFLKDYFGDSDIDVFWGGADDFVKQLAARTELGSTNGART